MTHARPPVTDRFPDLSAVRAPIAQANGLPNAHYTDPAVHDEERARIPAALPGLPLR